MTPTDATVERKKLDSWKEIADYLGRDVRTAMRWERESGLPVRRVPGGKRRAVFALTDEIDLWLRTRGNEVTANPIPDVVEKSPARLILPAIVACLVIALSVALRQKPSKATTEYVFELPDHKFRFESQVIPTGGGIGQIHAADVNGDGWPDIILGGATSSRLAVFMNQGGQFGAPHYLSSCDASQSPAVGDFDGDSVADIGALCPESNEVEIFWGDGRGNFLNPKRWKVGSIPITMSAADLNGDGLSDLVVGSTGGGPLVLLFGDRKREFVRRELAVSQPNAPILKDIDGDGVLDIVTGSVLLSASEFTFLRGHGDGTFDEPRAVPAGCHAWRVAAADFTGDGTIDLVGCSADGNVSFVQGKGRGEFGPATVALRSASPQVIWEFAAPKHNFVISLQFFPGELRLIQFGKDGSAVVSNRVQLPKNPRFGASADFNHDGLADLAVVSSADNASEIRVLLQKPDR